MKKIYLLSIILFSVSFVAILLLIYHECISLQRTLSSAKRSALVVIPTLTPTIPQSGWKIYKNEEYGFEFKYPEKYKQQKLNNSICLTETEPDKDHSGCDISISPRNLTTSAEKYIQSVLGLPTNISLKEFTSQANWDYQEKTINNLNWIIFHQNEGPGEGAYHNYVSSKNLIVDISVRSDLYKSDELSQILSTFKFISPSEPTSNDQQNLVKMLQKIIYPSAPEKVTIESTIQNNFASGTYRITLDPEGGPGGGWIAAKPSGKWVLVEAFQEPPSCSLMKQYSVPKSIYGGCIEKSTLNDAKSACISLQGQKAWDSNFSECNEAGTTKDQLKKLCDQYGGIFYSDSSTCRHSDFYGAPCGPEATYYCSFSNLK